MNILITGGCGFIGSNLAEFHLTKGDQVHVVDDLSTGSLDNIASLKSHPLLRVDTANILTWPHLEEAVQWADRIYHTAAVLGIFRVLAEPVNLVETNIGGSERLFKAMSTNGAKKRMLFFSSSSVYGASSLSELSEDDNLIMRKVGHSLSTYAISKLAGEAIAMAYYHAQQIPITIIRLFNVIGPRQTGRYGMVVPRFIKQACNNDPITIFGDGTQTRSFCDVRDVVTAVHSLAQQEGAIGGTFNVGNDYEISIQELAELVRGRSQSNSIFQYIPYEEAYGEQFTDNMQRRPNLNKLIQLTGFKHQWNLNKTIDYLISLNRGT